MSKKKTKEEFLKQVAKNNPDVKVIGKYTGMQHRIKCKCSCGAVWSPFAYNLVRGSKCPECTKKQKSQIQKWTTEKFVSELKKKNSRLRFYGSYKGINEPIMITCSACDYQWLTTPSKVLRTGKCPKCSKSREIIWEKEFIEEMNQLNPNIEIENHDYIQSIRSYKKIKCKCKQCNTEFEAYPHHLKQGHGCPKCARDTVAKKLSQPICCIETKVVYPSIKSAAEAVGLKSGSLISQQLHGRVKAAGGYHWEYVDDSPKNSSEKE